VIKLEPADIIITKSEKSWFGALVLKAMRFFQRDNVYYQHAMLIEDEKTCIEAVSEIQRNILENRLSEFERYKIIRCTLIKDDRKQAIVKSAVSKIGTGYSYKRIFLQLLDHIFHTDYFTAGLRTDEEQVCSSFVAWSYFKNTGLKFNGVEWQSCDPDDIDDASIKNPAVWETIYEYRRD
jgi:uncharacterized protein YycO